MVGQVGGAQVCLQVWQLVPTSRHLKVGEGRPQYFLTPPPPGKLVGESINEKQIPKIKDHEEEDLGSKCSKSAEGIK